MRSSFPTMSTITGPALAMPSLQARLHRTKLLLLDALTVGLDRLRQFGLPPRHSDISSLQLLRQAAFHRIDFT